MDNILCRFAIFIISPLSHTHSIHIFEWASCCFYSFQFRCWTNVSACVRAISRTLNRTDTHQRYESMCVSTYNAPNFLSMMMVISMCTSYGLIWSIRWPQNHSGKECVVKCEEEARQNSNSVLGIHSKCGEPYGTTMYKKEQPNDLNSVQPSKASTQECEIEIIVANRKKSKRTETETDIRYCIFIIHIWDYLRQNLVRIYLNARNEMIVCVMLMVKQPWPI